MPETDLKRDLVRDNARDKIRDDARDSVRDRGRDNNKIHEDEFFNLKEELHVFTTTQKIMCENHISKMDETIDEFRLLKTILDEHSKILVSHSGDLAIGKWVLTGVAGAVLFLATIGLYQWFHLGAKALDRVDNNNHDAIFRTK
jgi:hypothetical protein